MPAISYRGTSLPGGRESAAAAADPGKGVGRGVAGNANMFFAATASPPPAALFEAASFSAFAAAFLASSPARLFFCCAHKGKAKSALIANAAHQLRISFLPSFMNRNPFGSRARLMTARRFWLATLDASQLFPLPLLSRRPHFPAPISGPRENPKNQEDAAA